MASILTANEAANALRCDATDPAMLDLLPQVDAYIKSATGRDWTKDNPISPAAKSAARMLLVRMHEDPGGLGDGGALSLALTSLLTQLKALALNYPIFCGRSGAGTISLPGALRGEVVKAITGINNISGDWSQSFETILSNNDQIQQVDSADLSDYWFRAQLAAPGDS